MNMKSISFMMSILFLSVGMAHAAPPAKVVEAAKREANLMWWTSGNSRDAKKIIDAFNKVYPFIKVDFWNAPGEDSASKIWAEFNAGRHNWDVSLGADIHLHYDEWINQGVIEKFEPEWLKLVPDQAKDPNGYWAQMGGNVTLPAYNTNLVSAKEAPKSWDDLLDPKWKGKIGMHLDPRVWVVLSQPDAWGREKVEAYVRKLAMNKPQMIKSNTQNATLLVAGEFPISANVFLYRMLQYKEKGAPVDWVRVNPVVITGSSFIRSKKGPHPNAAYLWLDWIFSPAGIKLVDQAINKGAPFPGSGTSQSEAIKGVDFVVRDAKYYGESQEFGKKLQKILGIL